jgi:hypothetical protein
VEGPAVVAGVTAFRFRVRTQSLWKGTASAVPQQGDIDEGIFLLPQENLQHGKDVPQGLTSLRENRFCFRRQIHRLRKSSVLYQGTTLVGPQNE